MAVVVDHLHMQGRAVPVVLSEPGGEDRRCDVHPLQLRAGGSEELLLLHGRLPGLELLTRSTFAFTLLVVPEGRHRRCDEGDVLARDPALTADLFRRGEYGLQIPLVLGFALEPVDPGVQSPELVGFHGGCLQVPAASSVLDQVEHLVRRGGVVDGRAAAREEDPAVLLDLPHGEQHDVVARCDPGVLTVEGAEVLIVNVELRGVEALVEDPQPGGLHAEEQLQAVGADLLGLASARGCDHVHLRSGAVVPAVVAPHRLVSDMWVGVAGEVGDHLPVRGFLVHGVEPPVAEADPWGVDRDVVRLVACSCALVVHDPRSRVVRESLFDAGLRETTVQLVELRLQGNQPRRRDPVHDRLVHRGGRLIRQCRFGVRADLTVEPALMVVDVPDLIDRRHDHPSA